MSDFNWQNINLTISVTAAVISALLAAFAWSRRHVPGAFWFTGLLAAVSWVTLWYSFEALAGANVRAYVLFSALEYIGLTLIPLLWLGFALTFSGRERSLSRPMLLFLLVIPAVTIALAFTNDAHGLIWQQPRFVMQEGQPVFQPDYGAWFWVYVVYSYVIFFVGSVILVRRAFGLWGLYRAQAALVFAGTAMPWISNLLQIFDSLNPLPYAYLNAIFLLVCMVCFAFAVFRLRLLDIMPMAYDTIINNVPGGLIVVDNQDRIVAINPPVRHFLDDPTKDPIGQPLQTVFSRYAEHFAAVEGRYEYEIELPIQEWIVDVRITPVVDGRGRRRGRLIVFSNVTARAKMEEAERNEKRFAETMHQIGAILSSTLDTDQVLTLILDSLNQLFAHSHANIMLIDSDGATARVRKHRGYSAEAAALMDALVLDYRDFPVFPRAETEPVIVPDVQAEPEWVRLEGFEHIRSYACAPIRIDGKLVGFINIDGTIPGALTPDMANHLQIFSQQAALAIKNAQLVEALAAHADDLTLLYAKVSRLEQLKSDMIRIAAHDLKNPLTVMMSYLQILTDPAMGMKTKRAEIYEQMQKATERMYQIVQNFLSLERIQKVALDQTVQEFDLRDTVTKAIEEFKNRALDKAQQFSADLPLEACTVKGDPVQVYEAVANFISNAIKYTPSTGCIRVTLRCDTDCARIEVHDTGYGIPADQQAQIFQPFYRVQMLETQSVEGSGLGLHLTKKIIERQGGQLFFHSVYGEGSTFGFTMPLHHANGAARE